MFIQKTQIWNYMKHQNVYTNLCGKLLIMLKVQSKTVQFMYTIWIQYLTLHFVCRSTHWTISLYSCFYVIPHLSRVRGEFMGNKCHPVECVHGVDGIKFLIWESNSCLFTLWEINEFFYLHWLWDLHGKNFLNLILSINIKTLNSS